MTLSSAEQTLTWGRQLSLARQQQGLSIEQVATQLKLLPRLIEAIETENRPLLPEAVFVKGYIRLYANLLALPADSLCQSFEQQEINHLSNPIVKLTPQVLQELDGYSPHQRYQQTAKPLVFGLIKISMIATVLVLVGMGIWQSAWFKQQSSDNRGDTAEVNDKANKTIALPNVTQTAKAIDTLELRFLAQTQLRIADANGQELANATKKAGESLTLQGQSPFAIELNPASAVEFRFNNKVIDLKPYTVNGVVNFRLSR